jgi:flavodoxin
MKKIVCYFSATGTTKEVASKLNEYVKGNLFEIKPVKDYTDEDLNYMNSESRSSIEMNQGVKPDIKEKVSNIDEYDTVYLGFPIWWYTAPTIIYKFLEENDMSNKKIYVFATSGSSTIDSTYNNLVKDFPNLNFVKGVRFSSNVTEDEITNFI